VKMFLPLRSQILQSGHGNDKIIKEAVKV